MRTPHVAAPMLWSMLIFTLFLLTVTGLWHQVVESIGKALSSF